MSPFNDRSSPREVLYGCFGYDSFREHQEEGIHHLIPGKDAFVQMPTGSGKSICYQISVIILKM
jgi:ATP-dependent DNA helicase RecQ